jgi:iron complex outermembrane receptor protein
VKKVAIYKTQDASMIEGGVAGVISLETVQPLDYGKQRIQGEVKTNYNPDQANVDNSLQGDLGFRGTVSYVDQFEFDNGQALGISFGMQRQDISQPEAEYRSSSPTGSSLWACLNDPTNTNEGFYRSSAGDCEDQVSGSSNQGYDTAIDP